MKLRYPVFSGRSAQALTTLAAHFEVGLFRDRAGRVERQFVDQARLIEERNEDCSPAAACYALRIHAQLDFRTARRYL